MGAFATQRAEWNAVAQSDSPQILRLSVERSLHVYRLPSSSWPTT